MTGPTLFPAGCDVDLAHVSYSCQRGFHKNLPPQKRVYNRLQNKKRSKYNKNQQQRIQIIQRVQTSANNSKTLHSPDLKKKHLSFLCKSPKKKTIKHKFRSGWWFQPQFEKNWSNHFPKGSKFLKYLSCHHFRDTCPPSKVIDFP